MFTASDRFGMCANDISTMKGKLEISYDNPQEMGFHYAETALPKLRMDHGLGKLTRAVRGAVFIFTFF
jgi:hypothetical protein